MHSQPTIAFFGTPELCLPILDMLAQHGFSPALVITNPDRPVGRKFIMTPPPVKVWAQGHNIPVLQPEKLNDDFRKEFETHHIDLSIVVAYGKIMPNWLIEMPKYQTLNIHYSLLPKYRGASPVESALLHGETETGVCIQKMVHAMDAGPLVACETISIEPNETHEELRNRLNVIGAQMLVNTIPEYIAGHITITEQDGEPSYCYRTEKGDGEVNLEAMSPAELWNRYRAYYGWPGIFFFDTDGKRIKITQARLSDGKFIIEKVIPEGKGEISYL